MNIYPVELFVAVHMLVYFIFQEAGVTCWRLCCLSTYNTISVCRNQKKKYMLNGALPVFPDY